MTQRSIMPPMSKVTKRRHTQSTGLQHLPQEILLMISVCLPLLDLVALSHVCRMLWHLFRDDLLWRTLYRSTKIVRPPGPLPSQRAQDLRKILISSARVAASWPPITTNVQFERSSTASTVDPSDYCFLLKGRWLIAANSSIACYYDLWEKPRPRPTLFYKPHLMAKFFRCINTTNLNGDPLTFLVTETQVGNQLRRVNVCRVAVDDYSGPVVEQLLHYDLSPSHPGIADVVIGACLMVIKPKSHYVRVQPMIYDFKLLKPRKLAPLPSDYQQYSTFYHADYIMTKSYLLILYSFLKHSREVETILLAYPISPPGPTDDHPLLSYSHFTKLDSTVLTNLHVMSDDSSISGITKITLIGRKGSNCRGDDAMLTALRLTLDKGELGMYEMYAPTYELIDLLPIPAEQGWWLEAGPEECGRGVYNTKSGGIVVFSIDSDDGRIQGHAADPLPIPGGIFKQTAMAFDGYRGLLCVKVQNQVRNIHLELWSLTGTSSVR
ncbi:hypothetical protein V8B97DRAFT_1865484 [Scleroderma yunnanense]